MVRGGGVIIHNQHWFITRDEKRLIQGENHCWPIPENLHDLCGHWTHHPNVIILVGDDFDRL